MDKEILCVMEVSWFFIVVIISVIKCYFKGVVDVDLEVVDYWLKVGCVL